MTNCAFVFIYSPKIQIFIVIANVCSSDAFTIGMPPAWVDDSEEITFNIQKVRDKMGELAKAHSKALMPTFGDNKGIQREVEMLTHEITDLLRKSEKRLQKLSTRGPSEESNLRKNVQVLLAYVNNKECVAIAFCFFYAFRTIR